MTAEFEGASFFGWTSDHFWKLLCRNPQWLACRGQSPEHKDRVREALLLETLLYCPASGSA